MPHYKDGTEAKTGDIVRGKGYNLPYEVTGLVLAVDEGESCNIQVATVGPNSQLQWPGFVRKTQPLPEGVGQTHNPFGVGQTPQVLAELDYGACKDFELLHRP